MPARKAPLGSTVEERLLLLSRPDETSDCRVWTACIDRRGYGRILIRVEGRSYTRMAPRAAYETWVGPIPDGLTVDHVCFQPLCVNPAHLRLLTRSENSRYRRAYSPDHCTNGHERTPENTYWHKKGKFQRAHCAVCSREQQRAAWAARKSA